MDNQNYQGPQNNGGNGNNNGNGGNDQKGPQKSCLLYTSPSPRDCS